MINNASQHSPVLGQLCPCGKTSRAEVERIPRSFLIKTFLFWLPLRRYKCHKCRRKRLVIGSFAH